MPLVFGAVRAAAQIFAAVSRTARGFHVLRRVDHIEMLLFFFL